MSANDVNKAEKKKPHTKRARKALKLAAAQEKANASGKIADTPGDLKRRSTVVSSGIEAVSATKVRAAKRRRVKEGEDTAESVDDVGSEAATVFQKAHGIVTDRRCPVASETFNDAAHLFGKEIVDALLAQGFKTPTPIQAQAWPIALEGGDLIAVAKTGSGKTCAYLLPALMHIKKLGPAGKPKWISEFVSEPARPIVLVLAPTRELVQQVAVVGEIFAPLVSARLVAVFGGVPKGDQVRALREGADIVIATPGRLLDFSRGNEKANRLPPLALQSVSYLILDEADKMLDMGFEHDVRMVTKQCKTMGMRQSLFFTATWPEKVQQIATALTKGNANLVRIGQVEDRLTASETVEQRVEVVKTDQKFDKLRNILQSELKPGQSSLVFVSTKEGCEKVGERLEKLMTNVWVGTIHKGREQAVRDAALSKFREVAAGSKGESGILVATDVASRGLDISGVSLVVIYDFSCESTGSGAAIRSYVHRIGRTGRAGKTGRAITLFTPEDRGASELLQLLKSTAQEVPNALIDLARKDQVRKTHGKAKHLERTTQIKAKHLKVR